MARPRSPEDLVSKLADPGFTPSERDAPALFAHIVGDDEQLAQAAERALGRVQSSVAARARVALGEIEPGRKRALLRALSKRIGLAEDALLGELFADSLGAEAETARVAAANALGKLGDAGFEQALLAAHGRATSDRERDVLVAALVRCGSARGRALLEGSPARGPRAEQTKLIAERLAAREHALLPLSRPRSLPQRARVFFGLRRGLGQIVLAELTERLGAPAERAHVEAERIELDWSGDIRPLCEVRTTHTLGFTFSSARDAGADDAEQVSQLLCSPRARSLMRAFGGPTTTFRLDLAGTGKQRALVRRIAHAVHQRDDQLVNDPRSSQWHVHARIEAAVIRVDLVPDLPDDRFGYRLGDVPASSHPTIAAALVRVAEVRPRDVVWDPFVGSGLELCERSLAGRYGQLIGSDIDQTALEVAAKNLAAAGAERVELRHEDARDARLAGIDAMITNPPLGRRVLRDQDVASLIGEVLRTAARALEPRGRVVLVSPHPMSTARVASSLGLVQVLDQKIDLGGFDAVVQRFDRVR